MRKKKLFLQNLNYDVTNDELKKLFSNYGKVKDVNIIEVRGFGFVEMSTQPEAEKAKNALNGMRFNGKELQINIANEQKMKRTRLSRF